MEWRGLPGMVAPPLARRVNATVASDTSFTAKITRLLEMLTLILLVNMRNALAQPAGLPSSVPGHWSKSTSRSRAQC